jgi:Sulfatase
MPKSDSLVYAAIALRALVAGFLASALLMVVEYLLIDKLDSIALSTVELRLQLPILIGCAWFPYATAMAGLLMLAQRGHRKLASLTARQRWAVGLLVVLPPLTYGVYLALYTFSGPQVQLLWYRPFALALLPVLIAGGLLLPLGAFVLGTGRTEWVQVLVLTAGAIAALLINRLVLPEEYQPLHVLLSLIALIYSSAAAAIVSRRLPVTSSGRRAIGALGGALVLALAGAYFLGKGNAVSFLAYDQTPGARYLVARLDFEAEPAPPTPGTVRFRPGLADGKKARAARQARADSPAPHVIVVSIDNVQADRVGAYGYSRHPTTPNIDALAARGMVFERAYSWFPRTRVFLGSLLVGRLLPPFEKFKPPPAHRNTSVTRMLGKRDYHVLVHGWFDNKNRFTPKGFGVHTWMPPSAEDPRRSRRNLPHVPIAQIFAVVKSHFQRAAELDRPVFAWMHFLNPHPVSGEFLADSDHAFGNTESDKYDSAVAVADSYLAELQELAASHLKSNRPIYWFVTSDHGTGFLLEDGKVTQSRGRDVGEQYVHVPLIAAGPGIKPGRTKVLVSSAIDLAATVLDLAGIKPPKDYDGVSLMPVLGGYVDPERAASRAIYLQYYDWRGLIVGRTKVMTRRKSVSLFDVLADPQGLHNLADADPEGARILRAVVEQEEKRIAKRHWRAAKGRQRAGPEGRATR